MRELAVRRVVDVTPGMRRVTLAGEQLGEFTGPDGRHHPAFSSEGFDDDIRLLFPYPGDERPVLPLIRNGRIRFARGRRPIARAYTVRRHCPRTGELDVDVVLHGHGVASAWARDVTPGAPMHIVGPGRTESLPVGHDWVLAVGDDTALPAIARLLEMLPRSARGLVFLTTLDAAHQQELDTPPGVSVTWLHPEPGRTDPHDVIDAMRSSTWPDGTPFAWVAGEQSEVRSVRRHLVKERSVPASAIDFSGYWRRSAVATDA
nr:siderophore-interacting protein [Microbacterium sp. XT11]